MLSSLLFLGRRTFRGLALKRMKAPVSTDEPFSAKFMFPAQSLHSWKNKARLELLPAVDAWAAPQSKTWNAARLISLNRRPGEDHAA